MTKKYCSLHGVWTVIVAFRCAYYVFALTSWHWATPAEWITPFKCSCLSAAERRSTVAKRDDLHSKSLFLVKNKGQWNAKSGPKAAYGNFAMRTKFSRRLDSKWERAGRNWSNFVHWHTSVVQRQRMGILLCEQNFRDVWIRNESVRAEIGQILYTDTHPHTHTHNRG